MDNGLPVLDKKGILTGDSFFHQIILPTGSFSQNVRCSGVRYRFRIGALPRIFNYSTEHLDLLGNCKYLPVSSLSIKKFIISHKYHKGPPQLPKKNK